MVFIAHNTNLNLAAVLFTSHILSPSTTIQIQKIFFSIRKVTVNMITVSAVYTTVNIHTFSRTFNES